jgi:hypothetical protein
MAWPRRKGTMAPAAGHMVRRGERQVATHPASDVNPKSQRWLFADSASAARRAFAAAHRAGSGHSGRSVQDHPRSGRSTTLGETPGEGDNERGKGRREGYLPVWSGRAESGRHTVAIFVDSGREHTELRWSGLEDSVRAFLPNARTRSRRARGLIRGWILGRGDQKPGSEHSSVRPVANLSY